MEGINRKEIIALCEKEMQKNADEFKHGDMTYEELHSEQYLLVSLIEDLKGHDTVYVILKNSYEDDDIEHGELYPIYLSFNKEKRDREWAHIIESRKKDIENFKNTSEIYVDKKDEFSYTIGSWIYDYALEDYPLDTNMEYGFNKKR